MRARPLGCPSCHCHHLRALTPLTRPPRAPRATCSEIEYSGSEGGGDADETGPAVEAQNSYYRAKDEAASSYERGSATLLALLELEKAHPEVSEWGFKAVKRLTKMHIGVGNFAAGLQSFKCVLPAGTRAAGSPPSPLTARSRHSLLLHPHLRPRRRRYAA